MSVKKSMLKHLSKMSFENLLFKLLRQLKGIDSRRQYEEAHVQPQQVSTTATTAIINNNKIQNNNKNKTKNYY